MRCARLSVCLGILLRPSLGGLPNVALAAPTVKQHRRDVRVCKIVGIPHAEGFAQGFLLREGQVSHRVTV